MKAPVTEQIHVTVSVAAPPHSQGCKAECQPGGVSQGCVHRGLAGTSFTKAALREVFPAARPSRVFSYMSFLLLSVRCWLQGPLSPLSDDEAVPPGCQVLPAITPGPSQMTASARDTRVPPAPPKGSIYASVGFNFPIRCLSKHPLFFPFKLTYSSTSELYFEKKVAILHAHRIMN